MTTSLTKLLAGAVRGEGSLHATIPEDWMQGRSAFGGLQLALAMAAMRTLVPTDPLRTAQATFCAPLPAGPVHIAVRRMRQGKSATHVEARIVDGDATLALFVGVFGASRASAVSVAPEQPATAAAQPFEMQYVPGLFPTFTQHFSARFLRGEPLFSGGRGLEAVVEVGLRDDGPTTEAHVAAIADFIPPIALAHLDSRAFGSTLTWMLELVDPRVEGLPLAGWRIDAELVAAADGYTSQSVKVWGPNHALVALSRQSMLVFG